MKSAIVLLSCVLFGTALPAAVNRKNEANQQLQLQRLTVGRVRREAMTDTELAAEGAEPGQKVGNEASAEAPRSGRDFGDIASILAIAGAKPVAVDLSTSYTGRRKRQAGFEDRSFGLGEGERPAATAAASELPRSGRDFGDIASILAIAGAKPATVDLSGSYSGRRKRALKRTEYGLVPEVAITAVKIKSRGKHGNLAHEAVEGATPSRTVFESTNYGRKKRNSDEFIPFSVNEERKVNTLKIEQTDFQALPQRLEAVQDEPERRKRKFSA